MSCGFCNKGQGQTSDGFLPTRPDFNTEAIHESQNPDKWVSHCVVAPIVMSTTFKQKAPGEPYDFEYGRTGNPTRNTLEDVVSKLDCGKHGFAFATGIGAITSTLFLLHTGDHIICTDDVYGGTNQILRSLIKRMGIETSFVDCTVIEEVEKGIKPNTRMIWLESPTNPMMKINDIAEVSKVAKRRGGIIVVVDNTFLTAFFQRPLELGADVAVYSVSKYMNGHSDVVMGAAVVNDDKIAKRLRFIQNAMGAVPSPIDCYFVLRGLKTLGVRLPQLKKNSLVVAKWLQANPHVKTVLHPGLPEHPGFAVGQKQSAGHSSCFSFIHKGGANESKTLLNSLQIFSLAVSLGGYESMVQLPALMTHASLPVAVRESLGITEALVRIAVGLENPEALIRDLDQAFKKAFGH